MGFGNFLPTYRQQPFARLSIASLTFSGRKRANSPNVKKSTAMSSGAGASARLGCVPCTATNYTT
jgi:hypothetical protein